MSSQAPGWYADPYQRHESRYWNGQAWSEHVGDHGQTSVDPPGERPPQAALVPAPTAAQPGGPAPTYAAPWAAPAATAEAAPRRRVTPIILAGIVVIALVAGGVGLFIVNSSKPSQVLKGTATTNATTTLTGSNGWQLDVPVGAVPADRDGKPATIVVSVDKAAAPTDVDTSNVPSSVKLSGDVYQIEPEGQTFVTPVTLTLPIPQDLQADNVGGIAYLDVGTNQWVVEPAEVDVAAGVIRARITHFCLVSPWADYRTQLQAWQKNNGGYFDVTNTHVANEFFPSKQFGVPLPRYGGHSIMYGFCISLMATVDPALAKDYSWYVPVPDMFTVFTMPDGHNPGGTKSYWLPKGTYDVDEVWYGGEYVPVADSFYNPVYGFAYRPLGKLTVTVGSRRAFEESSATLKSADGWRIGRPDCAGRVVPSLGPGEVSPSPTRNSSATQSASATRRPSPSPSAIASTSASGGYWQYVETKNVPNAPSDETLNYGPTVQYGMTADGGHFSRVQKFDTGDATDAFSCTWSISSPTDPNRLVPGSKVEGTASCVDTSQHNSAGYGSSGCSLDFEIMPPGYPNFSGGTWTNFMTAGYQETKTAKDSLTVPAGPLAGDPWNGQIGVTFSLDGVGYTQRIYKWVPGGGA
jgi:Protein of unknown function (DUF2510)